MSRRKLSVLLVLLGFAVGCAAPQPSAKNTATSSAQPRSIEQIADAYLAAYLERYPELYTRYAIAGTFHDRLFDNSSAALARWQTAEHRWLAELSLISEPAPVGSRDWLTYGVLKHRLSAAKGQRICRKPLWETSTTTAWYTGLPFVFDQQPLETVQLRAQALTRLTAVAPYIDTEIANLRRGLALGYSSPKVTVVAVPEQVRALALPDSPFAAMAKRTDDLAFQEQVQTLFAEQVAPAVERFAQFIEQEYLPAARTSLTITAHPNGDDCYSALVRWFATVSPSAEQIHSLGLEQMAGIRAEMQQLLDAHFGGGAIEPFLRRITTDSEFTFTSEDAVLKYSQDALAGARQAMPKVFQTLPKANVLIKPYPAYAAGGVGEYHSSSEDGTRPGIFYIAVREPKLRPRAIQQSTLYHETYPGHHLQGAIALELGDRVHTLVRYLSNSGYSEGWALYAERVAQELGLYSGPLDLMGLLSDQGARAARLVIDSGLHSKGWTRQQAVDYMLSNTSWGELDIQNDVNRYISWPAQANAYMLGMLEIRRLRTFAETQLGDRFDLREFHDRVLRNGVLPLPMLEQVIVAWIEGADAQ